MSKPHPREPPRASYRSVGHAEALRDLLLGQPPKEAQFNDVEELRIVLSQLVQRILESQEVQVRPFLKNKDFDRNANPTLVRSFGRHSTAGVVYEHVPHGAGGGLEERCPMLLIIRSEKTDHCLVHQGGRLKGVGSALAPEIRGCELAQVCVYSGDSRRVVRGPTGLRFFGQLLFSLSGRVSALRLFYSVARHSGFARPRDGRYRSADACRARAGRLWVYPAQAPTPARASGDGRAFHV